MLYLISEETDLITDFVEEWLNALNIDYKRINDRDFLNLSLTIEDDLFPNATKIWHRRAKLNYLPNSIYFTYQNRKPIIQYINKETESVVCFIENHLKNRLQNNYIGSYVSEVNNNKLLNLKTAQSVGLKIPKTLITTNKKQLLLFLKTNESVITKDLRTPVNIITARKRYISTGVKLVTNEMINKLNDNFTPIFLQEYVPKKYETRIFVFQKDIYSMAIFSQNDTKTKIDFRNYNREKPNRNVPLLLPESIRNKILFFMKKLKQNTGSIDFIVTPKNEFVFLEINPMGQFHWLSSECNYYIEKNIAKSLSHE